MVAIRPNVENIRPSDPSPCEQAEDREGQDVQQLFARILAQAEQIVQNARDYVGVRKDEAIATGRSVAIKVTLGLLAAVVGLFAIGTATVISLTGLARGLGQLFGDRLWLGEITVGVGFLSAVGGGVWWMLMKWKRAARQRTVQKYEQQLAERCSANN